MSDLRKAAEQALEVLERAGEELRWQSIGQAQHDLRAALAEPTVPSDCPDSHQLSPKPVCDECGKSKTEGWALYCVDCMEPVFGQRKPLTVAETNALIDSVDGLGIGRHVMHKVARAIERAHGIGGNP